MHLFTRYGLKCTTFDLDTFTAICHLRDHLLTKFYIICITSSSSASNTTSSSYIIMGIFLSTTLTLTSKSLLTARSLIHMENNVGDRVSPCFVPLGP